MPSGSAVPLDEHVATQLLLESAALAEAWAQRVGRSAAGPFPALASAGHMAEVLRHVAAWVRDDASWELEDDETVLAAVSTLTLLRRHDGASAADVLRDYDALGELLGAAAGGWLRRYGGEPAAEDVLRVAVRLERAAGALGLIAVAAAAGFAEDASDELPLQQFADVLAHELNTSLNAAAVTTQLLAYTGDTGRSAETRRLLDLIRRNLARMEGALRDVRTAFLSPRGAADERVPFGQALGDAVAEVHEELVASGVRLDVVEPIPATLVDGPRVRMVLVNLIRNALRYTEPDRAAAWIRVSFEPSAEGWWVSVMHNGTELADGERTFARRVERGDGSSFGIMLARRELDRLGGRLELGSARRDCASSRFLLPETEAEG